MTTFGVLNLSTELRSPLLVDPPSRIIVHVVNKVKLDEGSVEILATEDALNTAFEDFAVASRAGDLVDDEALTIHLLESPTENTLLVGEEAVSSLLDIDGEVRGITTRENDLVEYVNTQYRHRFESAESYRFETPSQRTVQGTLQENLGRDLMEDIITTIENLEEVRDDVDVVTVALLIAAKHDKQFYQISKWGEQVGVGSKSTFSRRKTALEEEGVLSTEKVKLNTGRPRLRLKIADENAVKSILKRPGSKT
jgi:hypothetical protein